MQYDDTLSKPVSPDISLHLSSGSSTLRRCMRRLPDDYQCADLAEKWNAARDDAQLSKFSPKDIESFITAQKREPGTPIHTRRHVVVHLS
jgi:hypothetical protein